MTDQLNTEAARQRAKALSRWEGEGGALGAPAPTLDEEDMRILARLGAALLMEWEGVSDASRRAIFARASTLHAERDAVHIRERVARFIEEHQGR